MYVWDEIDGQWSPIKHYGGQWAGPIQSPDNPETMQQRRKRTQKQGPYKAGRAMKVKAAVGKIEKAMKNKS